MNNTKVAVALSGGIDSAVTAALLIEQGYEVIGITGKMTPTEDSTQIAENAKKVTEKLGIKHFIIDATETFEKKVIKYFEDSYIKGETPNPCIMCNKYIKWGILFDYAINELKADYIATGHYANIKKDGDFYKLYPASDKHKDQLYFLCLLTQEQMAKTIFPLCNLKKEEVKALAEKYNLPPKSAKESQDICFIKPPLTTKKYLNNLFTQNQGDFVDCNSGKVLGKHNGYWQYTIGQRKGIGIAAPEALYVTNIDSKSNTVYVGYKDNLNKNSLEVNNIVWSYPPEKNIFEALIKIRYNMKAVSAIVNIKNLTLITFNEPISGITPGQACVIYDKNDGHLLGGGFI